MFDRGLVIGKFMPFHRGHEYLIRFAQTHCHGLDVVVCTSRAEPIEGHRRYTWVNDTIGGLSGVQVHWFQNDLPQEPRDANDQAFWDSWVHAMRNEIHWRSNEKKPIKYDALFASDTYAWRFAEELGCEYYPVNPNRAIVPISGTMIRNDPIKYFDYLTEAARSSYVQKIVVGGPESCGKTMLCQKLAEQYKTIWVPEYGRDFYEMRGWDHSMFKYEHMEIIGTDHLESVDAALRAANRRIFIDTDVFATILFSKIYFNKVPDYLYEIAEDHWKPDHTLVCAPTVPWIKDDLRDLPHKRDEFFQEYVALLEEYKHPYTVIDSDNYMVRFKHAVSVVEKLNPTGGVPAAAA